MRRLLFSAVVLAVFQALWPGLAAAQYVGVSKCRPCHLAQTKSWEETRMAKAFELLKPGVAADAKRTHNLDPNKDYTSEPFPALDPAPSVKRRARRQACRRGTGLAGVQCEV